MEDQADWSFHTYKRQMDRTGYAKKKRQKKTPNILSVQYKIAVLQASASLLICTFDEKENNTNWHFNAF